MTEGAAAAPAGTAAERPLHRQTTGDSLPSPFFNGQPGVNDGT